MKRPLVRFAVAVCVLAFAASARADEPFGVSLLRPDNLAGWDHGDPPCGWTIAGGRLVGRGASTPLLSGWTFGDFELRFAWSVSGGAWKIALPEVPARPGLEIVLAEGPGCGRLTDGGKELSAGAAVSALPNRSHVAVLRRQRGKLALKVDGRPIYEVALGPQRRFGLGLAVQGGEATLCDLRLQEPGGEPLGNGKDLTGWWCPGDIKAWAAKDGMIARVGSGGNYLRSEREFANFTFSCDYKSAAGTNSGVGIRTPRQGWPSADGMEMQIWDKPQDTPIDKHQCMAIYGNVPPLALADKSLQWNRVVIKADGYMISAWMNGQLVQQYNTYQHPELKWRNLKGWIGFQDHNGAIEYRNIRVLWAPDGRGLDAWYKPQPLRATTAMVDRLMNSERLSVADGIVSGVVSVQAGQPKRDPAPAKPDVQKKKKKDDGKKKKDGDKKQGRGAKPDAKKPADKPQAAPAQKPEAPPAKKPEAQPAPARTAAAGIVDTLYFTAVADPSPAKKPNVAPAKPGGSAQKSAPPAKKTDLAPKKPEPPKADFVLAQLSGPGAVVRIARGGSEGTLCFYFDGEPKPRLECTPAELWRHVPEFAEESNPTLTCLTYKKSLMIVLKQAAGAEYRIDYVTFPAAFALETFTGPESGFPRGWLPALIYRSAQHRTGTHREYDALPRPSVEKKTIAPGKTERLVRVSGAGIVQWLKLQAAKQVLDSNDLWLEVTIDGEKRPALAAPARFWFPGLVGQGNYHNYQLVDRGGPTLRLAMPFAKGLTVSARNCGSKPIADVGLMLSVEPATDATRADVAGRMRLRGVFQPAGQGGAEFVHLQGAGRWIGLVYQQPEGKPTPIESLTVDGQARGGWSAADLEPFLGFLLGDARRVQSGRHGTLLWRYMALESVDFQQSLLLKAGEQQLGDRFVLYYAK